jgi:trehalose 6-phosphate synthase
MEPEEEGPERFAYRVRVLAFDPETYDRFYNGISNQILWFLHHQLWDIPRDPVFDAGTGAAWDSYRQVNEGFAVALDEEGALLGSDPAYLVQDYHLALVPAMLRKRRPAAWIAHFSHIPFAGPSYLSVLPPDMREELLGGLLGADVVGFQTERWADSFLLCCRTLPGARVDLRRRRVRWEGREVVVGVYPISIDLEHLVAASRTQEVHEARQAMLRWKGDQRLLLRVDRAELSKNILRGFLAYRTCLRMNRAWLRRVVFLALLNPSRAEIPAYHAYVNECVETADRINAELGEEGWQPIELSVKDDFARAIAAYGLYDVLLVNPVFDGMNLVAKEGPVLNAQNGILILSENAGAFAELGPHALGVNPFDVGETAKAIATALEMDTEDRVRRSRGLKRAIRRNRLEQWAGRQLEDLDRVAGRRGG